MKAIVCMQYGPPDVLKLREVDTPSPAENEVRIRVNATSVTRYDCWARSCEARTGLGFLMRMWFGINRPKRPVLGTELAGEIDAVGTGVARFEMGDKVFAYPGMSLGAYAEYICLPEQSVAMRPAIVTTEEAAAVLQGALTAMFFLRRANLQRGQRILILGASGGVGLYAVQLARRHYGAEVTGVCSTGKLEMVRSAGAERVIDYTKEDVTARSETYDVIFDTFGKSTFAHGKMLKKHGVFLFATYGIPQLLHILWLSLTTSKKPKSPLLKETAEDLRFVKRLIEAGTITPFVDRCFPLEQAADAHRYFETGKKQGSVVITVEHDEPE